MLYSFFYLIYLFSTIFLTANFLPIALSPRQAMAIIMFVVCIIEDRKAYFNKYWGLYLAFIFLYGFSSLITGYSTSFYYRLFGDFFVAYVACWATKIYCEKYSDAKSLLVKIAIFGLFDSLITIGQVYSWPYVSQFVSALNLDVYSSYYERVEYDLDMTGQVIPGLFRNGVMNGHFLMVAAISAFTLCVGKRKTLGLFILIFILLASYYIQQRSGFFLATTFVLFLYYRSQKVKRSKYKYIIYFFSTIIIVFVGYLLIQRIGSTESRYTEQGLSLTGREPIFALAFDYFKGDFFCGGFHRFINQYHVYPHNFFLNALITGGLLGGVVIIDMVFKQVKYIVVDLRGASKQDMICWILGLVFIATVVDSMVHNVSLCNGDVVAWLAWTGYYHRTNKKSVVYIK